MTHRDKALHLVDSFRVKIYDELGLDFNDDIVFRIAKQCALIAVDEIEEALINNGGGWDSNYWQQVKTEIEAL